MRVSALEGLNSINICELVHNSLCSASGFPISMQLAKVDTHNPAADTDTVVSKVPTVDEPLVFTPYSAVGH